MRKVIAHSAMRIPLGKQGENNAVRVVWPEIAEEYTKLYGKGRFELVVVQKDKVYPAIVNVDGADLVWDVHAADVAVAEVGSLELIYYVGDTIAKSQTWKTSVEVSKSAEGTTEPPKPEKNWVDLVLKSSSDAKQSATESAESAKQAAASREAIENMEASAVSLPPNSNATVEKDLVDGRVKLTFGIPRGEKDIFWLNTVSYRRIAETFDEILAAYKAGKSIWVRDTHSFSGGVLTAPEFIALPVYNETNIVGMVIVCGGSAYSSSDFIGSADGIMNVTYYINASPEKVTSTILVNSCAALGDEYTPNESQLSGSAGDSTSASPVDHIHPAPFPDWTNNINKALFVGNSNETPSQAFEWRDVPNGDFTSKVGDFLRVAEVDTQGKPTAWETVDDAGGETWEKIAEIDVDADAANDVFVWEYKNLPNYKELAYRKVNLVGSTEKSSGISISINGSTPQASGITYLQKGNPRSNYGRILLLPFGWVHITSVDSNNPTNYAAGALSSMYNAIPFNGDSITSVRLSAHTIYKIAGGKLSLYGRR